MMQHMVLLPLLSVLALLNHRMIRAAQLGAPSNPEPLSEASDDANRALQFAVCKYSAGHSSADQSFVLGDDILGATFTEQLTAGMTYRFFSVPLMISDCPNPASKDCDQYLGSDSPCGADGQDNTIAKVCDTEVQWQAWKDPEYKLLSINCSQM